MSNGLRGINSKLYSQPVEITTGLNNGFNSNSTRREVFYSVNDGNWNDPATWRTISGYSSKTPTANDDVYIRHNVKTNLPANTSHSVNNLFVSRGSILEFTGAGGNVGLFVFGKLNCLGTIYQGGSQANTLYLYAEKNIISNFQAAASTVYYTGGNQEVLNLNYVHLMTNGGGVKYAISDIVLTGNLTTNTDTTLELSHYNLTVNGTSNIQRIGLRKSGHGSVLFVGKVTLQSTLSINFLGNPNVELRGGLDFNNGTSSIYSGTGTWSFTTNTQLISGSNGNAVFDCNIIISGGIAIANTISNAAIYFNKPINNAAPGNSFANYGTIYFATQDAAENSLSIGSHDFTGGNTVVFGGNYSATLPSNFTSFYRLSFTGTGIKTAGANITVTENLTIASGADFDLAGYDISVTGTSGGQGRLSKTGSGNILFVGNMNFWNINFSGNPSVELRGGMNYNDGYAGTISTGTGTWSFTTNNQSVPLNYGSFVIGGAVNIVGAITITVSSGTASIFRINGVLNGNNVASTFTISGDIKFHIGTTTAPMIVGVLNISATGTTIGFVYNGTASLPYTTFPNKLEIAGTGTKSLSGNTSINGLVIQSSATLECSTYDLSNTGATTVYSGGYFYKSGAGSIMLTGLFLSLGTIDFSDSASVEIKGGIDFSQGTILATRLSAWTFTTNNQTLDLGYNAIVLESVTISGAITLIFISGSGSPILTINALSGNNVNSKFENKGVVLYMNASEPMATGILECNTSANTWKYNRAGNQAVKGGNYRTLELGGSGVKQLQGNVDWITAYSLTGTASVDLNGFTLS